MNGRIIKAASVQENQVTEKDLKLINQYTMKDLTAENVFTFKLAICDNQIDRDFEQFTDSALSGLAKLFKGKTVISDHAMSTANQCARVYNTEVIKNGDISQLVGYCYTIINGNTKSFIDDVEAGIKKEVSISCSVEKCVCSICGIDNRKAYCPHSAGRDYGGKQCTYKLDGAKDAYEVSFVAVPAQKEAGVIKSYGDKPCTDLPQEEKSIVSDVGLKIKLADAFNFSENEKGNY